MIRVVLAAVLAACSLLALLPGTTRPGGEASGGHRAGRRHGQGSLGAPETAQVTGAGAREGPGREGGASGRTAQRIAAGMLGVGCFVLVGGVAGGVLGLAVALGAAVALGRLETAAERRERLTIAADAPLAADLLSAALAAGIPAHGALPVVAEAIGGPLGERLLHVSRLLRLGQPAASAWTQLGSHESLRPIVAATGRSARTGAPLAELLAAAAGELRQAAQAAARAEIRAAAVRALLPLGLCLLPAFVLLSIVPLVSGLLTSLWQ